MNWSRRYIIKSYMKSSLWLVPFFAVVLFWILSRLAEGVDVWLLQSGIINNVTSFYAASEDGAKSMLNAIATANLSFLVFAFGSLLVAVQVAGGQYTPRIIATTLLRDNAIRFSVGYFVFTFLFSLKILNTLKTDSISQFNIFISGVLGLISVVVFLYLIDYAARFLRPVSIVQRIGQFGIAVIESIYPDMATPDSRQSSCAPLSAEHTLVNADKSGIILAVDLAGLVEQARCANGIIEFIPQIGDFIAVDEPLFRLYGDAGRIHHRRLRASVALGSERTLDQDPTFAFRILVDVAIKALSPAINDPTTAVLAIDQLHRLLRQAGLRYLKSEEITDASGTLRLIFKTPNWTDYVNLTCTEIRHCGTGSVQIMRRMRSMLENLMQTLPPHRNPELSKQIVLLDRVIETHYTNAEDRLLASLPDPQGLGGTLGLP